MFFKLQWRDTGIQSTHIRREEGASHSKGIIRKQKTTISTLVRLGLHILVQSSKESMALVDDRGHQTLPNKRPRSHSVMIPDEEEGELSLLRRAIELSSCVDRQRSEQTEIRISKLLDFQPHRSNQSFVVKAVEFIIPWKALHFSRESHGYSHGRRRRHDPFSNHCSRISDSAARTAGQRLEETIPEHRHRILIEMRKNSFFLAMSSVENAKESGLRMRRAHSHLSPFTHESIIVSPISSTIFV
jgi:hypothetical protein